MVVHHHERARRLTHHDAQHVPYAHVDAVDPARRDPARGAEPVPSVQREDPQLLVIERGQTRQRPRHDRVSVGQAPARAQRGRERRPPSQLHGRRDPRGLRDAETLDRCELADACARQSADAPVVLE